MGFALVAIRPLATVAASTALVVPLAADANAPTAPERHVHAAVSAAADPSTPAASRALPRIKGQVGPGMTITVNRTTVVKGRYRIVVHDESTTHNWRISGPGDVDRATSVSGTGESVWRVRLRPGTYTVVCDPHPMTMRTSLRVTAD